MIISEKSYVIILMIKHPTDNLDHQTKPTSTKQTSLIIKQTILKTNQPTLMFCKEQPYWFWLRQVPCLTFPKASEEGNLTSGDPVWGKSPNLFRHFPCNAVQCTNMQCWRLADVWTLGWVDLKVFERYLTWSCLPESSVISTWDLNVTVSRGSKNNFKVQKRRTGNRLTLWIMISPRKIKTKIIITTFDFSSVCVSQDGHNALSESQQCWTMIKVSFLLSLDQRTA